MTEMQKENERMRKHAREHHLERLYAEQNSLCYWCRSPTVLVRYIDQAAIIKQSTTIVWNDGGEMLESHIASIDHIVPLRDDKNNSESNLVMSCVYCNGKRARIPQKRTPMQKVCHRCHQAIAAISIRKQKRYKHCGVCFSIMSAEWLKSYGWEPVLSDNGHFKFRDPTSLIIHCVSRAVRMQAKRTGVKPGF